MSDSNYHLGQLVELTGKNLQGRIAYIGLTHFSAGHWIGVILDEEKGRNDGTVRGHCYFQCEPNYGIFVRSAQLKILEDENCGTVTTPNVTTTMTAVSSAANLLKTTQICAPKLVTLCRRPLIAFSSQQSLPTVANVSLSTAVKFTSNLMMTPLPPKRSKTAVSLTESFCCAKRSSFVETGFLEILQPQFTPGLPLRSPSVHLLANKKEQLQQHSELQSKIATQEAEISALQLQISDDKRKLQELDRLRLQHDKLLEFKVKIMEQHGILQRELHRSRYETRESNDARSSCMRELTELQENVELFTLDKEMAEERAETLQLELEIANERNEELALDLEILRAEQENHAQIATGAKDIKSEEEKPSYGQLRKLEQHNQRLKQTIISLRDLLTQEKYDLHKVTKELETKYSEIAELKQTKELFSQRIDLMEHHIIDFKEQVDAALGAESMVETLAEEKMELEERVKFLEEEVAELEALEEIHEQIIESNQEMELDLREELETLNKNVRTLQQEKNIALETIYDRDSTIQKFRELVRNLHENQQQYNKDTTASLLEDLNITSLEEETPTSLDYNHLFSQTKACGREVDIALNKMELKLSKIQCDYLLAFMPEDFMLRGSDNDVILLLISLQRFTEKVNIICNTINDRFPATYELEDGEAIFEGFSIHRYAFRCKSLFFLHNLKTMLQQVLCCMQNADYESGCKQAAAYRGEVKRHEQHIDEILKLLKSGELDENSSTSSIENAINFVNFLHSNLTIEQHCTDDLLDEHQLFLALFDIYEMAIDGVAINAALIQRIIQLGDECSESFALMQSLVESMDTFRRQLKVLRLKMPHCSIRFSDLKQSQMQRIKTTNEQLGRLINILNISAKDALRIISSMKFDDTVPGAIEHTRIWKIITINCFKLSTEVDKGPHHIVQVTTELLNEQIGGILKFIDEQEGAKVTNINTVYVRSSTHSILTRAHQVRQQWEKIKNTLATLEARDKEVRTLKYIVKMKQTEFSEMQIRKEMTERTLSKLLADHESAVSYILNLTNNLGQSYADKEQLMLSAVSKAEQKLSIMQDQVLKLEEHLKTRNTRTTLDCELTQVDLRALNDTLRREYRERKQLQGNCLRLKLKLLDPIVVPQAVKQDKMLVHFQETLRHIKKDWILSFIDLRHNNLSVKNEIRTKSENLSSTILMEYFSRHPHRVIESDFGTFVGSDVKALLN